MSFKKKVKKYAKKALGISTLGMFGGEKEKSGDDSGLRSAAAKRLINTQQQAGSGQIKFNTMEDVL